MIKLLAVLIALYSTSAFAGSGTLNYNSVGSATVRTTTDSNSYNLNNSTLWDYSAGANGLGIDANHNAGVGVNEWGGSLLGSPSNYGTSPGSVLVPGVNAYITNTPTIANTGFNALQGGSANAVGNPWYVAPGTGATFTVTQSTASSLKGTMIGDSAAGSGDSTGLVTVQGNASGTPIPVSGTLSASFSAYQPAASSATLSISASSARVALPTNTGTVVVYNIGSEPASTTLGTSSVTVTATTGDQIQPGCWIAYNPSGSQTDLAGIVTAGSSGSLLITGGTGLPAGGCSSSFSGSIGSVTQGTSPWVDNISQIGGHTVTTAANGEQLVGIEGSGAATLDAAVGAGTAPTNGLAVLGIYSSSAPTLTNGQSVALQTDSGGNLLVNLNAQSVATLTNNITKWDGTSLGAPSNYGTSPGAVAVIGVNAFVTNTVSANPGTAANWGVGATGSALPANASQSGVNTGNVLTAPHICGSSTTVSPSTSTNTQIVAPSSGKNIYVCDFEASSNGVNNFYFESATSSSCGGTLTQIGDTWYTQQYWGKAASNAYYRGFNSGSGNGLCVNTSAVQNLSLTVYYDQY